MVNRIYPLQYTWQSQSDFDCYKRNFVELRLIYRGKLSADGHATEKQRIRKYFHQQLRLFWMENSAMRRLLENGKHTELAAIYNSGNFNWVPLICQELGSVCELDILFLRREDAGNLVTKSGDLDNRLKTLFDGLRLGLNTKETADAMPTEDDKPMYVLLQDDKLITKISVTTDRLLTPAQGLEMESDVELVITVKTKLADPEHGYL